MTATPLQTCYVTNEPCPHSCCDDTFCFAQSVKDHNSGMTYMDLDGRSRDPDDPCVFESMVWAAVGDDELPCYTEAEMQEAYSRGCRETAALFESAISAVREVAPRG